MVNAEINLEHCLNLPLTVVRNFPARAAVYVIYATPNIVLYVGQTISLRHRLQFHVRLRCVPDVRVAWFPLPRQFHKDAERGLIAALCPVLNIHHMPRGNAHIHYLQVEAIRRFVAKKRRQHNAVNH